MSEERELLQRECQARFPGLLDGLPVEKYVTLLRRASDSPAYYRVPMAVRKFCREVSERHSPAAVAQLHKLLLTHFLDNPHDRFWTIQLSEEARALQRAEHERIRSELHSNPADYYSGFADPFLKDLGLCNGRLLCLGAQLIEPRARFPKRNLLLRSPFESLGTLLRIARAGGLKKTYFQFHTSERHLGEFDERGWQLFYDRVSDLLRLNPEIGGVFSESWYFDPALTTVSPRLSYLREIPEASGARTLFLAHDEESARLAALKSPTRRTLIAAGKYRPASYLLIWPRNALIRRRPDYGLRYLRRIVKRSGLRVLKSLGGFRAARAVYRRKLRILGYHGISIGDLHEFDAQLFIRKEVFERRMRLLRKWNLKVIPLRDAVSELPSDGHPDHAVVLTFDDGWCSIALALPVLEELSIPFTLYVATYYAEEERSVFDVLVRYLFWKSKATSYRGFELSNASANESAIRHALEAGEALGDSEQAEFLADLAGILEVDLPDIERRRLFHYFTAEELRRLPAALADLELHTHRHELPQDSKGIAREVNENREALRRVRAGAYQHICYPSGVFSQAHFELFQKLGIRSATTTENHLNGPRTPLHRLGRYLDRDGDSDLEFEAEITGTLPLLRALLGGNDPSQPDPRRR